MLHKSIRRDYEAFLRKHRIGVFDEELSVLVAEAVDNKNEKYVAMVLAEYPELSNWVEFCRAEESYRDVEYLTISDEELVARQDKTGNFCINPVGAELLILDMMMEWLEGEKVLALADIGCGLCHRLTFMGTRNLVKGKLCGVDASKGYIEGAMKIAKAEKAKIEFHQSFSVALPFADGELSHIISVDMLPWVLNWESAIAEFGRVLCPGGKLKLIYNERIPRQIIRSAVVMSRLERAGISPKRLQLPDKMNQGTGVLIHGTRN